MPSAPAFRSLPHRALSRQRARAPCLQRARTPPPSGKGAGCPCPKRIGSPLRQRIRASCLKRARTPPFRQRGRVPLSETGLCAPPLRQGPVQAPPPVIYRNPQPRRRIRSPGAEPAIPGETPRPRGGSRPYIKEETLASRQGISLVRLVRSMRVGNPTFDRTNVARILVKNKFSTRFFTKKRRKIAYL